MPRIMFYDTECNTLNKQEAFIQELGWAVFDLDTGRLISAKSHILKWNLQYTVDEGAFLATGLTRDFCEANGKMATEVLLEFLDEVMQVDYLCGHNIMEYDNEVMITNLKRGLFAMTEADKVFGCFEGLIVDTMLDLPTKQKQIMGLKYLALDHGYVMSNAHQALADVFACSHVFFQYDKDVVFKSAQTPLTTFYAQTVYGDQFAKDLVYAMKFRWNPQFKVFEKTCRGIYTDTFIRLIRENSARIKLTTSFKVLYDYNLQPDQLSLGEENPEIPF